MDSDFLSDQIKNNQPSMKKNQVKRNGFVLDFLDFFFFWKKIDIGK